MRFVLKVIMFLFLICQISLYGQNISTDSLIKKARLEIYDNPEKAISIGKKLIKQEKNVTTLIKIHLLLSTANIAKRDFDESLQYILKAKELAQKTNDTKAQINVLVSVAIQYQQMELFSKSLEILNEADNYLKKLPENSFDRLSETARSYAIRGMIYKSQSNSEIALEKFLISIKNFEKINIKKVSYANMSVVYYNIGYCYINLNNLGKAQSAFEKSFDYAQKINAKSLEAFALKGLAEMYKQKQENQTALTLLLKAESLCKNTGDLILNEGIYKETSENYLALGKPKLYQTYNKKYFEMRFKREQNELSSINHSIDNHNTETIKKSQELKNRYSYFSTAVISISVIFLAIFSILLLKIRKQNRKYQQEIQQLIRS